MKKEKNIIVSSKINLEHLVSDIQNQLTDEEMVKLAISFGDNGDLTYELRLLQELCKLIPKVYPLSSMGKEDELVPVVKSLLELKKHLKFLDNE